MSDNLKPADRKRTMKAVKSKGTKLERRLFATLAGMGISGWKKNVTSIKDIIKNTPAYNGKDVVIQGKIQTECPAGCWFIVDDGVASIYIDILPSNFVIPQEAGSDVKVFGTVTKKDGDPIIIGKVVEIDGEIFK